ncbi:MAG: hypothetical protein M3R59_11460 [Verrucomicrobiota bacterium]|nr:hypothetical protein [Verrucomicrobiota bacterium]
MSGAFIDLSARAKLRVTGADRVRFLNGQTTNDVRGAKEVREACVLNAKGHLEAHIFFHATDDAIWIDVDEALREKLMARLDRYVIADDVVIEDVTEDYALFHVLGDSAPEIAGMLRSRRLTADGWDLWTPRAPVAEITAKLFAKGREISPAEWETMRIEQGIPRWGHELAPEIIPPEANLEARAIDYAKGCYIGQEVISRMKMSGQTRQRLVGVIADEKISLTTGMELMKEGKTVGRITSVAPVSESKRQIALAMIKRGANEPGTQLTAPAGSATVRVVALPFQTG